MAKTASQRALEGIAADAKSARVGERAGADELAKLLNRLGLEVSSGDDEEDGDDEE